MSMMANPIAAKQVQIGKQPLLYRRLSLTVICIALFLRPAVWYLELSGIMPSLNFTTLLAVLVFSVFLVRVIAAKSLSYSPVDVLVFVLAGWCVLIVWYNHVSRGLIFDGDGNSYTKFVIVAIQLSVLYYIIGREFLIATLNKPKKLLFFWALLCIFFLSHFSLEAGALDLSRIQYDKRGVFLSLADMFALASLIVLAAQQNRSRQVLVFFVAIIVLYTLLSRSSLVAYMVSGGFYILYRLGHVRALLAVTALLPVLLLVAVYLSQTDLVVNSRMIGFIADPFNDPSFLTRTLQLERGISDIISNPFFGVYGGQIDHFGGMGWYVHNVLAYWRQFGFFAFSISVYVLFFVPAQTLNSATVGRDRRFDLLFLIFTFSTVSLIFARSFEWYFCWLMVGYSSSLVREISQTRRVKS